jgi:hypothetical protein
MMLLKRFFFAMTKQNRLIDPESRRRNDQKNECTTKKSVECYVDNHSYSPEFVIPWKRIDQYEAF